MVNAFYFGSSCFYIRSTLLCYDIYLQTISGLRTLHNYIEEPQMNTAPDSSTTVSSPTSKYFSFYFPLLLGANTILYV